MDPIHDARRRFDVRFHLVAIAFLVFDVEVLFLYPWAVASRPHIEQAAIAPRPVRSPGLTRPSPSAGSRAAGWCSPRRWCSSRLLAAGFRLRLAEGSVSMAVDLARQCDGQPARRAGQLVPQEQPVADAVRHGLLRHRADGHRRQPARHGPVRRRGVSLQPAAVRSDDRGRPRGDEDAAGVAADLAADARAEVVHFDGGLRFDRRRVRHVLRGARDRSLHSRSICTCRVARRGRSN